MKFVHAADLHIDSPLSGLARYEGANVEAIRTATRRAWQNLVDLCLEEQAAFLLLAGDIFDGDWKDYATGLFFAAELSRLRAADIPVVLVRGNHDAASHVTRHLRLPDNVRELSVRTPESFPIRGTHAVIHGQGFAQRAVTEDLAAGYPRAVPGAFNIGLLHTAAGGRIGHENYAPCRIEELLDKGYSYWALGHVHEREVLCREPYIVFPGNLQGRHMRETGSKGATLVTVDDGRIASVEHRPLDVVRWQLLDVDVTEGASGHDAVDLTRQALERTLRAGEERTLALRIVLHGPTGAHAALSASPEQYTNEIRLAANDVGAGAIFVEKVVFATQSAVDLAKVREQDDAIGHLARALDKLQKDDSALRALSAELADIRHKLPLELREGPGALSLDERYVADLLGGIEQMLIVRLLGQEREP